MPSDKPLPSTEKAAWGIVDPAIVPVVFFAVKAHQKVNADRRVAAALERLADWTERQR